MKSLSLQVIIEHLATQLKKLTFDSELSRRPSARSLQQRALSRRSLSGRQPSLSRAGSTGDIGGNDVFAASQADHLTHRNPAARCSSMSRKFSLASISEENDVFPPASLKLSRNRNTSSIESSPAIVRLRKLSTTGTHATTLLRSDSYGDEVFSDNLRIRLNNYADKLKEKFSDAKFSEHQASMLYHLYGLFNEVIEKSSNIMEIKHCGLLILKILESLYYSTEARFIEKNNSEHYQAIVNSVLALFKYLLLPDNKFDAITFNKGLFILISCYSIIISMFNDKVQNNNVIEKILYEILQMLPVQEFLITNPSEITGTLTELIARFITWPNESEGASSFENFYKTLESENSILQLFAQLLFLTKLPYSTKIIDDAKITVLVNDIKRTPPGSITFDGNLLEKMEQSIVKPPTLADNQTAAQSRKNWFNDISSIVALLLNIENEQAKLILLSMTQAGLGVLPAMFTNGILAHLSDAKVISLPDITIKVGKAFYEWQKRSSDENFVSCLYTIEYEGVKGDTVLYRFCHQVSLRAKFTKNQEILWLIEEINMTPRLVQVLYKDLLTENPIHVNPVHAAIEGFATNNNLVNDLQAINSSVILNYANHIITALGTHEHLSQKVKTFVEEMKQYSNSVKSLHARFKPQPRG